VILDDSFYQAADAILAALGVQPTPVNVNLLAAWSWCEKPHYPGGAWQWNNPLNTTLREPGSASANGAGVQAYPTQQDGAAACAATIENGYYPHILAGIQASDPGMFFAAPSEWSTWGTDIGCVQQTVAALDPPPAWSVPAGGPAPGMPPGPPAIPPTPRIGLSVGQKVAIGAGVVLLIGGGIGLAWWLTSSRGGRRGTALRRRGSAVGPLPPRGAFLDVDTRVPEEIARAYLEDLPPEEVRRLLGATPDTERAFVNLLRFQAARRVPTRLEQFPPIVEDGRVTGTILGAYLPEPGNEVVWLGPQVLSEDPRALDTQVEEVVHSLLHSPACDVYGKTRLPYAEMPQEIEAKTAGMLARLRAGIPFETDTGRRIDPAAVRARADRIEADMGPLMRRRVEWAADVTARAIRGDIAGAAAASSACPRAA